MFFFLRAVPVEYWSNCMLCLWGASSLFLLFFPLLATFLGSWLQPEDGDRGDQVNWSMDRVQPFGMADCYTGPRFWVCFNTGMLEQLLGKPQVSSSADTTTAPLKVMEVNKETKTVWSKGCFLKVNWKKQVVGEDRCCLLSVDNRAQCLGLL